MLFWLEKEMRPRITSGSYETNSNIVNNHVIPAMGNIKMTEIKRSHIQKLYNEETAVSVSIARLVKTVMNTSIWMQLLPALHNESRLPFSYCLFKLEKIVWLPCTQL